MLGGVLAICVEVNSASVPRSAWKITFGGRWSRKATAMFNASVTSSVRRWSAIAQPMTRREQPSRTTHGYAQPCWSADT